MERNARQDALLYLINQAEKQGYVTFDNIMNCADAYSLSIQDFDWLSNTITTRGILVYDETPLNRISLTENDEDYTDYAQSDYEAVYNRIIELDESLKELVEEVRNIIPPQWREFGTLKYQVLEGNQHARERIIEMHLRIALKIALQRAELYDMDISDAVGEACVGLVKAVDKYNPDVNGPFGPYASMWILQNLKRRQSTRRPLVYYPVHKKESYFMAYPILKEYGFIANPDDYELDDIKSLLADRLSFTDKQIEDILVAICPFESYEEMFGILSEDYQILEMQAFEEDESIPIPKDFVFDANIERVLEYKSMKEQLQKVLGTLTRREKKVLELRYGLNDGNERTLEEVGKEFNVTRERIRQIEGKALRKLRHPSRSRKLRDYVDLSPSDLNKGDDGLMTEGDSVEKPAPIKQDKLQIEHGNQFKNINNSTEDANHNRISANKVQKHQFNDENQNAKKKRGRPPKQRELDDTRIHVPKRKSGRPKKQLL